VAASSDLKSSIMSFATAIGSSQGRAPGANHTDSLTLDDWRHRIALQRMQAEKKTSGQRRGVAKGHRARQHDRERERETHDHGPLRTRQPDELVD
jgi:hypothetical protein